MVSVKFVAAFIASQKRFDLIQLEVGFLEEPAFLFDNIKTELDMFPAVTGQRIEANSDLVHPFSPFRGGLFLNIFDDGANEMNFMHNEVVFNSFLSA